MKSVALRNFLEEGERTGTARPISAADFAMAVVDELETLRYIKARFTAGAQGPGLNDDGGAPARRGAT